MKQDWTEQLRNQLADYEMPAPQGLWDDIEAEMQRRSRRARIVSLRRRWAVAAALLVLLSSGVAWLFVNRVEPVVAPVAKVQPAAPVTPAMEPVQPASPEASPVSNALAGLSPASLVKRGADRLAAMQKTVQTVTENVGRMTAQADLQEPAEATQPSTQEPVAGQQKGETVAGKNTPTETATQVPPRRRRLIALPGKREKKQSLTANLYGANLLASNSMNSNDFIATMWRTRGVDSYGWDDLSDGYQLDGDVSLVGFSDEADHKQPVGFGLTLTYPLTDRIWIESGLVYTYLQSSFYIRQGSSSHASASYDQKLHYLGIPLSVGYRIWQTGNFSVYGSAGVEADLNIAASVDGEKMDKDRVQFSGALHAGAEYQFLPHLNIYVEPGVRAYIDNNSSVKTIFKDKPVQFDLELGFRYSLK